MSTKRVFIIGMESFTGHYLVSELASHGYEIFGTIHQAKNNTPDNVFSCDLNNTAYLTTLLQQLRPDYIINLAAISFVDHSIAKEMYEVNQLGTLSLLNAITASKILPQKILLASTAHVYGSQELSPISESAPLKPNSHYAVSKLAMEQIAHLWFDRLPILITRPFNYTGIGQSSQFLPAKIVAHFVERCEAIELGNIDVARDWSDIRDVVRIYQALLECPEASIMVNVCSGKSHPIRYILDTLSSLSSHQLNIRVSPNLMRVNDIKDLHGDPRLLRSLVGDMPMRPLNETLSWMFSRS